MVFRSYSAMSDRQRVMEMKGIGSMGEFEKQKAQELEMANSKLRSEVDRLMEERFVGGPEKMDFKRLLDGYLDEIGTVDRFV